MSIRSLLLTAAIGFAGIGTAAASPATTDNGGGGGGFVCTNGQIGVGCIGSILVLPINVNVQNVGILDDNQLKVLSDDLNGVAVLETVLDDNKILNDVYATVLNDFLTKFGIPVDVKDIGVCTSVLGISLCH
ncbi:MAG TPA: hypothetical protein VFP84_10810 [Kofleriaceae bacterium]|nr:hypothetical protein [Kofleriaceae bacterium]